MKLWRGLGAALLSATLILANILVLKPASAADRQFNLTTSPLPINLTILPGQTTTTDIRVQDSATVPAHIKVSLLKFKASDPNGEPQLVTPGPADEFVNWVHFSATNFTAQPGEWVTEHMTISPPTSAAFGYYFAVLFSNSDSNANTTGQPGSVLQGAVATLVLLNVKVPGEKVNIQIAKFSSVHKIYEYLPATFNVLVHNSGNIHSIISGSIYIKKGNKALSTLDVNPGAGNVLPNSNRLFSVSWADGFPVFVQKTVGGQAVTDKSGKPVEDLTWNFSKVNKFRIGRYTAHLLVVYSDGNHDIPVEGDVSFWVIPWKIILVGIIILAIVGYGLFSIFKRPLRRASGVVGRLKRRRGH